MPGPARMPPPVAQDSPTQTWIQGWIDFLGTTLPMLFLVIVVLVGTILIVKSKGGLQKAIIFGLGAALVFLILTNVDSVADLFRDELPLETD